LADGDHHHSRILMSHSIAEEQPDDDDLLACIQPAEDIPDLDAQARQLRAAGMTFLAIANELGVSVTDAWRACQDDSRCRRARGEHHWAARLTSDDVLDIRALVAAGVSKTQLAREYNVHRTTVSKAASGQRWRWLA
jgi:DNA invertase Pin-like site-specific DNA recombinase